MGLKEYRRKRRFDRTTEPEGKVASSETGRLYVVQKHAASRLHYDLRLEMDGVLKSWAVPKGPSLNPGEKHLAVQVEDHPIEYGGFEGIIPEDEYGGGTVMLWDRGEWEPQGDPQKGYRKGKFKFRLNGQKLKGLWVLTRMQGDGAEDGKNWLLIKKKDEYARKESEIVREAPLSVDTGRSLAEIAADRDRVWSSRQGEVQSMVFEAAAAGDHDAWNPDQVPGARRSPMPKIIAPQLAYPVKKPPQGDDWLHEIKFDGYRILGFKHSSGPRLVSRNGKDWTEKFTPIANALKNLPARELIIDGEIVVVRADGTSDFQALQNVLKGVESGTLTYYGFDLLYLDGYDLTATPLIQRKAQLQRLIANASRQIRFSDHIQGSGPKVYQNACRYALEGVISKQVDAVYRHKRTRSWVKSKCLQRQEFIIVGYSQPSGSRTGFGALLLGYYTDAKNLKFAGRVGTGFNEQTLHELSGELKTLQRKTCPLTDPPTGAEAKGVRWVEPVKVAEVEFSEWTEDGRLRQPSFKGIREDKPAAQVRREQAEEGRKSMVKTSPVSNEKSASGNYPKKVAGVRLSNPDRILYPDQGITKAALADFYRQTADWFLPHVTGRPLTLVRCPQGRREKCFYQKHLTDQLPEAVKGIPIKEKDKERTYILIEDLSGLIALVQMGVLEFHPWGSRGDRLERPDRMIFDMDPGPGIAPAELVEGCRLLRRKLETLGLQSFIKTSGGKGFHLVVPLVRRSGWDEVKRFSGAVARRLASEHPQRFTAVMSKAERRNKIFVDYLRNGRGATSVAPFSTRARPNAPVSTPIGWDEFSADLAPDRFTVANLSSRLEKMTSDPWAEFFDVRQSITVGMKKELKMQR